MLKATIASNFKVQPDILYQGDDALSTKPVIQSGHCLLQLLGGERVNPQLIAVIATAMPPSSTEKSGQDKHHIGNV